MEANIIISNQALTFPQANMIIIKTNFIFQGFQTKDGNKEYCMDGMNKSRKEIAKDKELDM